VTAVPTARGDAIDSSELGFTLMHEHLFTINPEINENYPHTWGDEEHRIQQALDLLNEAKAAGVDTIVDVTCIGLGRSIPRIKRIAAASDVNIIVATGIYTWNDLPAFFTVCGPGSYWGGPEIMDDMFVRDIEDGIADTGVRAGILKCATDVAGVTPAIERVLRATASAHRRTGVPITTHTRGVQTGLEQQRIFMEEGVDLSRVVLGHMDWEPSNDLSGVERLIENGSTVSYDSFGLSQLRSDEDRADRVAALCARGYADRIVLSHDRPCYTDMFPEEWYARMPEWRYTRVTEWALPALRERGVTDAQLHLMTSLNARRIFESAALGPY
jgi:phosphotriesterase-related protein